MGKKYKTKPIEFHKDANRTVVENTKKGLWTECRVEDVKWHCSDVPHFVVACDRLKRKPYLSDEYVAVNFAEPVEQEHPEAVYFGLFFYTNKNVSRPGVLKGSDEFLFVTSDGSVWPYFSKCEDLELLKRLVQIPPKDLKE